MIRPTSFYLEETPENQKAPVGAKQLMQNIWNMPKSQSDDFKNALVCNPTPPTKAGLYKVMQGNPEPLVTKADQLGATPKASPKAAAKKQAKPKEKAATKPSSQKKEIQGAPAGYFHMVPDPIFQTTSSITEVAILT
jgi:cell envelope opacity-associated protein A